MKTVYEAILQPDENNFAPKGYYPTIRPTF